MSDPFNLQRFVDAQQFVYDRALDEVRAGHKTTHWIWYIFPQLRSLGRSPRAYAYGITSLDEARAYLAHPVLGPRLRECTEATIAAEAPSLNALFGSPDDLKFRSCMTLFAAVGGEGGDLFGKALKRWCGGEVDPATIDLIAAPGISG